jgi:hypothetical protein
MYTHMHAACPCLDWTHAYWLRACPVCADGNGTITVHFNRLNMVEQYDNLSDFTAAGEEYSAAFDKGHLPLPPARQALVLACMDARLHPEKVLGLQIGDCHCVRNAGVWALLHWLMSDWLCLHARSACHAVVCN